MQQGLQACVPVAPWVKTSAFLTPESVFPSPFFPSPISPVASVPRFAKVKEHVCLLRVLVLVWGSGGVTSEVLSGARVPPTQCSVLCACACAA